MAVIGDYGDFGDYAPFAVYEMTPGSMLQVNMSTGQWVSARKT